MENNKTRSVQQELWQENSATSSMASIVEKLKQTIAKLSLPGING